MGSSRIFWCLIGIHVLLTGAGVLLHFKNHSPGMSLFYWWAAPVSLFNLVVVTGLYLHSRTAAWGAMLNYMSVAIGIIGMSYYSSMTMAPPYTIVRLLAHSTVPFSLLLLVKVPLGVLILAASANRRGGE